MNLVEFLSSAVVSAIVAGLVTLRTSERKIEIENITKERAKWREKIRENAYLVRQAATRTDTSRTERLSDLRLTFELLLNPRDPEDLGILSCIDTLKNENDESHLFEFSKRVSYLLKHDWERAKCEAKPWYMNEKAPLRTEFYPAPISKDPPKESMYKKFTSNAWNRVWIVTWVTLLISVLIFVIAKWPLSGRDFYSLLLVAGILPGILLYILGLAVAWIIRGFKGKRVNQS